MRTAWRLLLPAVVRARVCRYWGLARGRQVRVVRCGVSVQSVSALSAPLTPYVVPDGPKMLRETLCIAQAAIGARPYDEHRKASDIARLQRLIDECDRHRPTLPNGKHDGPSERCTAYCGCQR